MPTTNGTQIYRYHRTQPDYNVPFDKRMREHLAMVFACVDYTVTPIDHNRTLTQYFHRLHPVRRGPAPPCDSICPVCCRIMCPSVYCTVTRPVWIAFSAAPPTKSPLSIAPVSKTVLSVSKAILLNGKIEKFEFFCWSILTDVMPDIPHSSISLTFATLFIRAFIRITVIRIRIDPMASQLIETKNGKRKKVENQHWWLGETGCRGWNSSVEFTISFERFAEWHLS